jgi:hypothetical protein
VGRTKLLISLLEKGETIEGGARLFTSPLEKVPEGQMRSLAALRNRHYKLQFFDDSLFRISVPVHLFESPTCAKGTSSVTS